MTTWTRAEDEILFAGYAGQGAAWCAKQLDGKTGQDVQRRAHQLGLRRTTPLRGKLTSKDVRFIRTMCAERRRLLAEAALLSADALAEKFGVHPAHVRGIEKGRRCKEPA